jgi:serine/threonine-protein kinase
MKLRHPNIVRVYDGRDVGGTFIMVMELVDGASLKSLLDDAHPRAACMPVAAALFITRELLRALGYAHSAIDADGSHLGIIHRDVSPHNVLLDRHGTVKLADFGLAEANVHEVARNPDLVGGKFGYLAPEVVLQRPTDHRMDLFAAGIVVWETLAGRRLFRGENEVDTLRRVAKCEVPSLRSLNPKVPEDVEAFISRLLHPEPMARFDDAAIAAAELEALLGRLDATVGPRDVALMLGIHVAKSKWKEPEPASQTTQLQHDLDELVRAQAEVMFEEGASPLDPNSFEPAVRSGVRPMPTDD